MSRTLVLAFWQQRLASPLRLALLAALFAFPLLFAALAGVLAPVQRTAYAFALVLAAGAIGQEVSSGVLQLTLARPVSRAAYVLSRWLAATLAAGTLGVAQVLAATAAVAARGEAPGALAVLALAAEDVLVAGAGAAVMLGLSALADGLGDVGLYALALFGLATAGTAARVKGWSAAAGACDVLGRLLRPEPSLAWLAGAGAPDWGGLAAAPVAIALGLAAAIVALRRKELSYASG